MKNNNHCSIALNLSIVWLLLTLFTFSHCQIVNSNNQQDSNNVHQVEKQKGAHLFAIVDSTDFQLLKQQNLEWITLVSWGFQDGIGDSNVSHHNDDSLRMMQHDENWIKNIKQIRSEGFKVFFKPHLWINDSEEGKWRSDIFPTNDENWETWQETYRDFIIRYAKVAEKANAEMYCVGVEFTRLSLEKPEFWRKLIQDVRNVYSGKITYAANWYKEYENVTFWEDLDYIGIQAYFPLAKHKYPSTKQVSKGWKKYLSTMKSTSKKYNRRILFTEMGYKSTANCAIEPWEWVDYASEQSDRYSAESQANCYQAFFDSVWKKNWFAGVHIWQYRGDFKQQRDEFDLDFSPQGKLAEEVIRKGFE